MSAKPVCWGVYRELAHSPGREADDALILRAVAQQLSARGFTVDLKSPDELPEEAPARGVPPYLFVMCERVPVVERLAAWEKQGVRVVNRPAAIRNTDRAPAIELLARHHVPYPPSVLVPTSEPSSQPAVSMPCWVKRGDVHATEASDVTFAADRSAAGEALLRLNRRGVARAVLQEHVAGDLIKFYGVAGAEEGEPLSFFRWFYHRDQKLKNHPFDPAEVAAAAARGGQALGLEVFGGDAIATADGRIVLIDVNAWPSFALYREEAAASIAALIEVRFLVKTGVSP